MSETAASSAASPWAAALRRSHERLAAVVAPLTPEQVRGPSFDTEWTIAQVLSHVGSGAEIMLAVLAAALKPDGELDPATMFVPVWDVWNARTPDEQATEWLAADDACVARFEALTADEIKRSHLGFAGMDLDAEGVTRLRLSEHALHTWDVAVSLDPTAAVAPDAVALIVDTLPGLAARTGTSEGSDFRVEVHATDPDRRFLLSVGDAVELTPLADVGPQGGSIAAPPQGGTAARLSLTAEALVLLVYGRLRDDRGAVVTPVAGPPEGDDSFPNLGDIRRVFPGF